MTWLSGTLLRRYKRFLADIQLQDNDNGTDSATGQTITAHCANSGSLRGMAEPGRAVWVRHCPAPGRALSYSWEVVQDRGHWVGINTARPNRLVAAALEAGVIAELAGYTQVRREVRYGDNSRIDLLLEHPDRPPCYVEIKNVTLAREHSQEHSPELLAEFPDSVTARGTKHMHELAAMAGQGARAVVLFVVQREDCTAFTLAADIDPAYAQALRQARAAGVEVLAYACHVRPEDQDITLAAPLPVRV